MAELRKAKKVFVLDDDPDILEALSFILEDAGYEVKIQTDWQDLIKTIVSFKPDTIIMDILLSGFDGRTICKKLKANPVTKNIPIIMISAHPDVKRSAYASGADDYIAKPFDMYELQQKVAKFM